MPKSQCAVRPEYLRRLSYVRAGSGRQQRVALRQFLSLSHLLLPVATPRGRLLRRVLEREYDVLVMTSAREALDQIGVGKPFDLILCDLMMPGLTGMDFHERLEPIAA